MRQRVLEAENRDLRARVDRRLTMVGESPTMGQLREQIAMAAPTNGRVLVFGENGTGKELVARTVHALSRRHAGPFIEVNCAAIPEELIESELFGHVRGAFTGAVSDRRGKFEAADGGTIFLDEIGDMSLKTQAKVLRALQEQVVEPVGSTQRIKVDARVIAATNKDLPTAIRSGEFREDLYFRLAVIPIFVPPLRERQDDIAVLAEYFMTGFAKEYGRRPKAFAADAVALLQRYAWPGNVRELRNLIERLVIMAPWRHDHRRRPGLPGSRRRGGRRRAGGRRRSVVAAARRARPVRARLHPPRAGRAARQHVAHRRRARRRAQQPVSQDAGVRHRARTQVGRTRGRPTSDRRITSARRRGRRPQRIASVYRSALRRRFSSTSDGAKPSICR